VPVRLSTFSTNFVSVDYAIETSDSTLAGGTLQFVPGEIVKIVGITAVQAQNQSLIRLRLYNPVRAEITAYPSVFFGPALNPQRVYIRKFREGGFIFWSNPAFQLEQADTLTDTWMRLPTPSPAPVDFSAPTRFYRLSR
jgi:hypothetical protein